MRADFKRKQTRRFQTNNITLIIANPVSIRFSFFAFSISFIIQSTSLTGVFYLRLLSGNTFTQFDGCMTMNKAKLRYSFNFRFFFFGQPYDVILLLCIRNEDVMQCLDSRAGRVLLVVSFLSHSCFVLCYHICPLAPVLHK